MQSTVISNNMMHNFGKFEGNVNIINKDLEGQNFVFHMNLSHHHLLKQFER